MPPILSITAHSKTYEGGHVALDDVSLDIVRGKIFALLGPDGAGKATSIGVAAGMLVLFLAVCLGAIAYIFRTGWRLRT